MKKILILILIIFISFSCYRKNIEVYNYNSKNNTVKLEASVHSTNYNLNYYRITNEISISKLDSAKKALNIELDSVVNIYKKLN